MLINLFDFRVFSVCFSIVHLLLQIANTRWFLTIDIETYWHSVILVQNREQSYKRTIMILLFYISGTSDETDLLCMSSIYYL